MKTVLKLIAEKNTVRNEKLITTFRNACNQSIYIHNNITLIEHKHNAIKLNLEKCWSIENKTQDVKIECKDGNLLPFILNYCEALFDTFAITKFNTALSDLRELLYNEYTGKEIDLTKTM
ncbi:hypothetical protein A3Q56_00928 [Intoshia linei]|uniref:Uncharacterized protein n=1 Tax=Intoshia linei TaxID=1819745 RepID=A0A177BAI4_9BILA|nr:hypothetical protein A3Q56_00928 [Intoshia linei]